MRRGGTWGLCWKHFCFPRRPALPSFVVNHAVTVFLLLLLVFVPFSTLFHAGLDSHLLLSISLLFYQLFFYTRQMIQPFCPMFNLPFSVASYLRQSLFQLPALCGTVGSSV